MKIKPSYTVAKVLKHNNALFSLGSARITKEIESLPEPQYVSQKKWWVFNRKIKSRPIASITLGELDAINSREDNTRYFINTLGIMLGLVRFKKHLPNGDPDWLSGWEIDEKAVGKLKFIRAFRYFIQIQKDLDKIAQTWRKLGTWRKDKKQSNRPNRGLASICRQLCQLMNGSIKLPEAWNTPWSIAFEAFENCDLDNKEQHDAYESAKRKNSRK